jgi:hypothetical protein
MRPLASPVREMRAAAIIQAVGALLAVVLVVVLDRTSLGGAVVLAVLTGAVFGVAMWALAYRRFLADALAAPAPAPDDLTREQPRRTVRRALLTNVPLVVIIALLAIAVPGLAGILAGNAAGLAWIARAMLAWQSEHGALLLREPVYRTQGPDGRTGRGFIDPVDFRRADLR